jgi:hypothetical protein
MRVKFERLKTWGLWCLGFAMILFSIQVFYTAIAHGVVSVPLHGKYQPSVPVTFHDHPFWFCFGITACVFVSALFAFLIWNDFATTRRINQRYPMRNRW